MKRFMRSFRGKAGAALLMLAYLLIANPPRPGAALAQGARPEGLPLPAPGSYTLNRIQRAPQGVVLEGGRWPHLLSSYTQGRITLLSFFYTSCADRSGCPLAWAAFEEVRKAVNERPDLQGRVRLVFISLDPARDTPAMLALISRAYGTEGAQVPWHFLTTYSNVFLAPMLRGMGEDVSLDREASSKDSPVYNHMLKVFLIDPQGWVREIYSNGSLDPKAILSDMTTLALEGK